MELQLQQAVFGLFDTFKMEALAVVAIAATFLVLLALKHRRESEDRWF